KAQRRVSRTPQPRAERFLERIHSDLFGPYPTGQTGVSYAYILTDDATRFRWIHFVRQKDAVTDKVISQNTLWQRQLGYGMGIWRHDNGTEVANSRISSYCAQHGIHIECSAPYT